MKKLLSILLTLALCVGLMPAMAVPVYAATEVDNGTCGENVTWTLDDEGLLTISGTGEMEGGTYAGNYGSHHTEIKSAVFGSGVTNVGSSAFYRRKLIGSTDYEELVFSNLTNVQLSNTIKSIGANAFYKTTMDSIVIPDSVTTLDNQAFEESGFTNLVLPDSVVNIGYRAFASAKQLEEITFPDTLTSLSASLFASCTALKSVHFNGVVQSIDDSAFYGCTALPSLKLAVDGKDASIGNNVFYNVGANVVTIYGIPGGSVESGASTKNYTFVTAQNTFKFDTNGGTGTMDDLSVTFDTADKGNFPANSFTNGSKTFAGWNTKADGTGLSADDQSPIRIMGVNGTVTLYAQWSDPPATLYDLYIAGTQVTSANATDVFGDGKVSFEANTATLTLNGYSFSGEGYGESFAYQELFTDSPRTNARGAIFSKLDNLTIFLSGTNSVTEEGGDYVSAGIFATGDVTIEGSGSLTATGGDSGAQGSNANNTPYVPYLCGIFAKKLVLNSGTVNCTSGASTRSMNGITTNGLYVFDEFVANGGTLFAIGGSSNSWSYGGQCGTTTINDGDVTISGGAGYNSYGLFGGVLNVYGGELTLRVVSATNQQRALGNQTRTFGPGVSVVVSPNMDGSEAVPFSSMSEPANNAKYLKTSYVPPCTVTITPGANMTKTEDSGAASQTGLTGAMTDVVYTADENYYFPTDYAVASVNGISVTRNDYTKITVSGTPTADAAITLTAPTAKTKLPTPNASFAVTGDSELEILGLIDGTTYRVGLPDGGSIDLKAGGTMLTLPDISAGTFSIKAVAVGDAANEHIDSDAVEVTITKAAAPASVDKTDCTTEANNDGAITGVDNTMEYKKDGDSAWSPVTGTSVTGLVPGTYSVRVKASGKVLASDAKTVTIASYAAPTYTVSFDANGGSETMADVTDVTGSYTLPANGFSAPQGKQFKAWDVAGTEYQPGDDITISADTVIKAVWEDVPAPAPSGGGGGTKPVDPEPVDPEPSEPDDFPFVDVPEEAYYRKPVEWAVEKGITNGVSEDEYGPELSCTRAQVVTFLWITCGSPDAGTATGFDDVDVEAYYDQAVAWAVEQGITAGTSEDEFSPDMVITRAQFVTMLWVSNGMPEPEGEIPFKDVPADAYYAKAVAWAYANDITAGKSADCFAPEDPCTRGQIMTLLYNAYGE